MIVTHKKIEKEKMDYRNVFRDNLKFCVPIELQKCDSEFAFKRILQRIAKSHT